MHDLHLKQFFYIRCNIIELSFYLNFFLIHGKYCDTSVAALIMGIEDLAFSFKLVQFSFLTFRMHLQ